MNLLNIKNNNLFEENNNKVGDNNEDNNEDNSDEESIYENNEKEEIYIDKILLKKLKNSNIIREISNSINKNTKFNKLKGIFYLNLHNIFIFLIAFITVFNTSITHLIYLLIVVSLDAFSVVILHECPLSILEQKYLGLNGCELKDIILKNMKIFYNCNHTYEKQIEILINIWTIIAAKILILIFLKMFNIKLINFNNIYL